MAEDTCTPGALATWEEPTGSAVPMYSVTTASRMAARRALRMPSSEAVSALDVVSAGGFIRSAWHSSLPSARASPSAVGRGLPEPGPAE